ncbi:MAG: hypothetical protein HOH20_03310 [Rhodospirillaceae bacterium]|nr:hypothetical protein [Rhodospirillaceae bacterium]MBT5565996.1 hypothetical protein [Rhodospirillaceae bacterium]MBT6088584.1 hypothetical protein [Rhodospirillaceae bacterium]
MEHHTIRGRIRYTSKKKEILDKVRGGETFIYTTHVDGSRSLRTHCSIDEGSPLVLRDTVTNVDKNWTPTYGFVQIHVNDAFVGSSWFRFTETMAECEGYTVKEGRISQRLDLDVRPSFFGTHPIQADAMHTNMYPLEQGPGTYTSPLHLMCSFHHRGADGPILMHKRGLIMNYFGEEDVTVEAGTFKAHHFSYGTNKDDDYMGADIHPPYHTWVTADGDYVLLKAHCTGYMQTYYELVEYEKKKNSF